MPTTFANSIDSNPIYAVRAENDKDGNRIDTTYAKLADIPSVPVTDVEVNGTSVVSSGVAEVTVPTKTSDLTNDSNFITLADVPAQVQADWTESDSSDPSYIANKPTINNVPAVTSSDDAKVLKASYTGGVGSYSWETETGTTYSAGTGIDITSNTISVENPLPASTSAEAGKYLKVDANGDPTWATGGGGGSTYTAGNGIDITSDVISVDTSVVATQTDLASKQDTLTAGTNVSITNNVISATDTTYSAGTGIDITNNTVSAKVDGSTIGTNSNGELESLVTQENADWNAVSGAAEILNKPVPKTLTAGSGISITENQSTITITNTASAGPTYTAGDGIKISNQNVISKDETVLWEDTNGATSAQLSESIFNFETIKIFYAGGERYGNRPSMELAVTSSVLNNGIQISDWFINSAGTFVVMANGYYTVSQTGDELTGSYITHMWFSVPNFTYSGTGSSGVKIFKVVGIHRIASN